MIHRAPWRCRVCMCRNNFNTLTWHIYSGLVTKHSWSAKNWVASAFTVLNINLSNNAGGEVKGNKWLWRNIFFQHPDALHELNRVMTTECAKIAFGRPPPDIVSYAVWLYYRFNLSHCDIQDLLAKRSVTARRDVISLWSGLRFGHCLDDLSDDLLGGCHARDVRGRGRIRSLSDRVPTVAHHFHPIGMREDPELVGLDCCGD